MQPIITAIFTTPENDVYSSVLLSPTEAEIYCNDTLAYGLLSPADAVTYMKNLKALSSKKQERGAEISVRICLCKCHNKIEKEYDDLSHCTFCLSGRFIKK